MKKPEPIFCPTCGEKPSHTHSMASTLMYVSPFFDDDGLEHFHDINRGPRLLECAEKHVFAVTHPLCWCGWPTPSGSTVVEPTQIKGKGNPWASVIPSRLG